LTQFACLSAGAARQYFERRNRIPQSLLLIRGLVRAFCFSQNALDRGLRDLDFVPQLG
jgi:hypothetical protein